MEDCFINEIREENGWYGFINKTDIDIPNATITTEDGEEEDISINSDKITMYIDNGLYKFRISHRDGEAITYSSESLTEPYLLKMLCSLDFSCLAIASFNSEITLDKCGLLFAGVRGTKS